MKTMILGLIVLLVGCSDDNEKMSLEDTEINDVSISSKEAEKHCPGEFAENENGYECSIKGIISRESVSSEDELVWIPEVKYRLSNMVFVSGQTTLIIRPGTTIVGETDTLKISPASLVIDVDATIEAKGTKELPIVFTSSKEEGERKAGDWGGLVLVGKAQLNAAVAEIGEGDIDGNTARGGGDESEHSSGILSFLRIEFAGRPVYRLNGDEMVPSTQLHGLNLLCVGSNTEIDHIQVHRSDASGVYIDGGAVNMKYVIVDGAKENGILWKNGWVGGVQFAIVHGIEDIETNVMLHGQNNTQAPFNEKPRSSPIVYNVTIDAGNSGTQNAMLLENGTAGAFGNILITDSGFKTCVDLESEESWEQTLTYDLTISGSIVPHKKECFAENDTTGYHEKYWFEDIETNRSINIELTSSDEDIHQYLLEKDSDAYEGSVAPPKGKTFFDDVVFVGAVGKIDWTKEWTEYPEN